MAKVKVDEAVLEAGNGCWLVVGWMVVDGWWLMDGGLRFQKVS